MITTPVRVSPRDPQLLFWRFEMHGFVCDNLAFAEMEDSCAR
ncbi:MAG TPA: hypothetical protein VFU86_19860 [Terriglobales bacterium]|nr:hypothetical protein [Terriglobales bacterium]